MPFGDKFRGRKVLVTGHTGFKGSWLSEWLLHLGAEVFGIALPPATDPALFSQLGLAERMDHQVGDIRDPAILRQALIRIQPDFVFHLAAQPLVRLSYTEPVETYATNVMGTIHLLEALRGLDHPCAAVLVTTDKCYENHEDGRDYREEDPLGGHDPYSSSKGACEIAIASWRRSFFQNHPVRVASARAGNVIGGGDWARDRIIPDCMRALARGDVIPIRNPAATRPWQHVLEPLSGYLWLAACLADPAPPATSEPLDSAFNFGPAPDANRTVAELAAATLRHWPGEWRDVSDPRAPHEAHLLSLAIEKAARVLRWHPTWRFEQTVEQTAVWYRRAHAASFDAPAFTRAQIDGYTRAACQLSLPWSQ